MIGPNPNIRPLGAPGMDVTLANPGFFDQAAFPAIAPLGLGGLASILPMGLPLAGLGEMPKIEPGKKPSKKEMKKLQEMGAKMQKDYIQNVIGNYMQSSMEVHAQFSAILGKPLG